MQKMLSQVNHRFGNIFGLTFPLHLNKTVTISLYAFDQFITVLATGQFVRETPRTVIRTTPHEAHESGEVTRVDELDVDGIHALLSFDGISIRRLHSAAS